MVKTPTVFSSKLLVLDQWTKGMLNHNTNGNQACLRDNRIQIRQIRNPVKKMQAKEYAFSTKCAVPKYLNKRDCIPNANGGCS